MALYEFNPEDARRFASERGIATNQRGDELIFKKCPYCGMMSDKKYKFAINLKTGAFNCLRASCGARGNMITLHKDFGFDLGQNVSEYERPRETWKRFVVKEPFVPTDPAVAYLHGKRGISEDVIRRYEIVTKKDDDNVLVFPFYDEVGDVAFIKYRKIDFDPERDSNKEWSESGMKSILFGIKQCKDFGRLIITEGQIDSLSVATAGFENAVSVPTGKNGMRWVPHNWDWVRKFKQIVVFGDYERGEMTLLPEIRARFASETCQILAVQPDDYMGCKDANEILLTYGVEQIRKCVNNAKPVMLKQVARLVDIQYEDEAKKEYMPTGIAELDKLLNGGLRFGYLDILTGKRGEGKSTFGSMLLKSALEGGYGCFVYSGEMRAQEVRRWLDYQIAGCDKIESSQIGNVVTHKIPDGYLRTIWDWYKDLIYAYDTSVITDEETDLMDVVETYVKQFNCRFVLLDNLMTAVDISNIEADDKYEKQARICKRLARIAQTYNALIVLVAHKKKGNSFGGDENDDVLGSSEITNLAGVIMSYGRGKDIDESQRLLKVLKEREKGRCNFKGMVLNFDPASKRIYGNTNEECTQGHMLPSKCFLQFNPIPDGTGPEIPF